MARWEAEITGATAILFHADDIDAADELARIRAGLPKGQSVPGDDRSPPFTYQYYFYYDDDKNVTIPSDNIMSALRKAGSSVKVGKGKVTLKALSQTAIMPLADTCPFYGPKGQVSKKDLLGIREKDFQTQREAVKKLGFDLLCKRASVGSSKHVRVRPRFMTWKTSFCFLVNDSRVDDAKVLQPLFDEAGKVGLGDWRPGGKTPGRYGQFTTTLKRSDH